MADIRRGDRRDFVCGPAYQWMRYIVGRKRRRLPTLGVVVWGDLDNVGANDLEAREALEDLLNFLKGVYA